jgi:hypothetical protein
MRTLLARWTNEMACAATRLRRSDNGSPSSSVGQMAELSSFAKGSKPNAIMVHIGANGDNDTLPFDTDNRFVAENKDALAQLAFMYFQELTLGSEQGAKTSLNSFSCSQSDFSCRQARRVFASRQKSIRFGISTSMG